MYKAFWNMAPNLVHFDRKENNYLIIQHINSFSVKLYINFMLGNLFYFHLEKNNRFRGNYGGHFFQNGR